MDPHRITDLAMLEDLYGPASEASLAKEVDFVHALYRPFIEKAPFMVMATCGPGGLDTSPRGDPAGFVVIEDEKTLLIPDRRGNNRTDSLRNLMADPRISLIFLVPGVGETLRVNGTAEITVDPALLQRFVMDGKPPRSVIRVRVDAVYFQCSKALVRSALWNPEHHVERRSLPSSGTILAALSNDKVGGPAYDAALPERISATLY